jgi:hypothetical protein
MSATFFQLHHEITLTTSQVPKALQNSCSSKHCWLSSISLASRAGFYLQNFQPWRLLCRRLRQALSNSANVSFDPQSSRYACRQFTLRRALLSWCTLIAADRPREPESMCSSGRALRRRSGSCFSNCCQLFGLKKHICRQRRFAMTSQKANWRSGALSMHFR